MRLLFISAFAASLMVSPDTLVVLGQFFGRSGSMAYVAIAIAVFLFIGCMPGLLPDYFGVRNSHIKTNGCEIVTGSFVNLYDNIVKIVAAVFITTGLTVSAGFAFNEIFVNWFPNFGFAFLVLILLSAVQFLPMRYAVWLQVVLVLIAGTGLVVLTAVGLANTLFFMAGIPSGAVGLTSEDFFPEALGLVLILFIGLDLGKAVGKFVGGSPQIIYSAIGGTLIAIGLLFSLWGFVLLAYLPEERLVHSTINHILGAKAVLGNSGRMIMGAIIIFGTCASVNGMFTVISQIEINWPGKLFLSEQINRPVRLVLIVALTAGVSMASGLAGYSQLETFIRGSLILWLISYALNAANSIRRQGSWIASLGSIVWIAFVAITTILLVRIDENPLLLTIFIVSVSGVISLLAIIIRLYRYKYTQNYKQENVPKI